MRGERVPDYRRSAIEKRTTEQRKGDEPGKPRTWSHAWTSDANARSSSVFRKPPAMAMSWRPKTASAFATFGLARRVVNVLSTYPGATLTKMTLVPNSSLGIQNTFVRPDEALALKGAYGPRPR